MFLNSTLLDTRHEDVGLQLLRLEGIARQGIAVRGMKTYTEWKALGLSDNPTPLEVYKAMPKYSMLLINIERANTNIGFKAFDTPTSIYIPAVLVCLKVDRRLSMMAYNEQFSCIRTLFSSGSTDTKWGRLSPSWTTIPVPDDLTSLNQIKLDGTYYIPSTVASSITGHPYAGDQVLEVTSSHYGGNQRYLFIKGAAASNVMYYKSPLAASWRQI